MRHVGKNINSRLKFYCSLEIHIPDYTCIQCLMAMAVHEFQRGATKSLAESRASAAWTETAYTACEFKTQGTD